MDTISALAQQQTDQDVRLAIGYWNNIHRFIEAGERYDVNPQGHILHDKVCYSWRRLQSMQTGTAIKALRLLEGIGVKIDVTDLPCAKK